MTNYREILRLKALGLNHSAIAESVCVTRQTVSAVLQKADILAMSAVSVTDMSDRELASALFPQGESIGKPVFKMPDYDHVQKEIARPGVTLQLLWAEYYAKCREAGELPYQLTQFKKYYREYTAQTNATMHINRNPGELMEVDWAGQTAKVFNTDNGEDLEAYIFVSALPFSGYGYVEAFWNMRQESWIVAHVNAYEFFGGVTRILVPDNLKTGVIKHTKHDILLNRVYQELAEHYGTAIIPTRVRTPKDKATVEGAVGIISTFILAAIRNMKFFSLAELNETIRERLHAFNNKPFQKKDGSRASIFADERAYLMPLPKAAYELSEWRIATVTPNYHVCVDERYYSVPFEYIKRKVDIRLTRNTVEIFHENIRIASHIRLYGMRGEYRTETAHMPPNHKAYIKFNSEYFRAKSAEIGAGTAAVAEGILTGYKVEQQGYRACMSLLKLKEQYAPERLEAACTKALEYMPRPSVQTVQAILKSGQDKPAETPEEPPKPSEFSFTRGADYYKGGNK